MTQYSANIDLASLNGSNGFKLSGVAEGNRSGWSVASAGDVNGDGFADLVVGAAGGKASYVVFGKATGFAPNVDLSSLDGSNGFKLSGGSGSSVASAGDVNGDGFDDVIVAASFVVFGRTSGFAANLDLTGLDGSNGFRLAGGGKDSVVASAGDINGDGFADLIIGNYADDSNGINTGASYVVLGKASGFPAKVSLASLLDGNNGFTLRGESSGDFCGRSVASAGDVNGDGFDDVIIGAHRADNAHGPSDGTSYVVFGKASGFASTLSLSSLGGNNGFKLIGVAANDHSGWSVASAGDVNGDGFADLIIGAPYAEPHGDRSGASYVVFGKASGFASTLELSSLDGNNGFKLSGVAAVDYSGQSVASAGDVNGDGFDDVIIGAADPWDGNNASYVIFGKVSGFAANVDLSSLDGDNGFKVSGLAKADMFGWSVASAGDVNGDGFADLIIGAPSANSHGKRSGASYVIYGRAPDSAVFRVGTVASQTLAGGAFDDTLSGLGGDDRLFGNGGNDNFDGGLGDDTLYGGAGNDSAQYSSAIAGVTVSLAISEAQDTGTAGIDTLVSIENLVGSAFADVLTGNDGANVLSGEDGDDSLNGGLGDDALYGGTGNDALRGLEGSDLLYGEDGDDELFGREGDDDLQGGAGNDSLAGGDGNDELNGGKGKDTARYASAGAGVTVSLAMKGPQNTVAAGVDTLISIENLVGSAFADVLTGNGEANVLSGNAGKDRLTGGEGNDTFQFDTPLVAGEFTTITDLSAGIDRIALACSVFTQAGPVGPLASKAFYIGSAAHDASDRIIYNSDTGALLYDPDGTGSQASTQVAEVSPGLALTNRDFSII